MKEVPGGPDDGQASAGNATGDVEANGGVDGIATDFGHGTIFAVLAASQKMEGRKFPMRELAVTCSRFLDRPVVDMTELKGNYDFTLQFSAEDFHGVPIRAAINGGAVLPPQALKILEGSSENAFFNALKLIGLKLERSKAPVEILVIDNIEETPTEN